MASGALQRVTGAPTVRCVSAGLPLSPGQPRLWGAGSLQAPPGLPDSCPSFLACDALAVMDDSVKSQPFPSPEGGLLTTVLYITSPSVIEDINLFLHPVSSMLSRSPSSPHEGCVCQPSIILSSLRGLCTRPAFGAPGGSCPPSHQRPLTAT